MYCLASPHGAGHACFALLVKGTQNPCKHTGFAQLPGYCSPAGCLSAPNWPYKAGSYQQHESAPCKTKGCNWISKEASGSTQRRNKLNEVELLKQNLPEFHKARLRAVAIFVLSLISEATVNLQKLSLSGIVKVKPDSVRKRFSRLLIWLASAKIDFGRLV